MALEEVCKIDFNKFIKEINDKNIKISEITKNLLEIAFSKGFISGMNGQTKYILEKWNK